MMKPVVIFPSYLYLILCKTLHSCLVWLQQDDVNHVFKENRRISEHLKDPHCHHLSDFPAPHCNDNVGHSSLEEGVEAS